MPTQARSNLSRGARHHSQWWEGTRRLGARGRRGTWRFTAVRLAAAIWGSFAAVGEPSAPGAAEDELN
jgi:hypothetical protein